MKMRLSRMLRLVLIGVFILITLVSAFLAAKAVTPGEIEKKVPQYSYSQQANVNYRAYLFPNSLYAEKSLAPGMVYVSPFVDYINTFFSYQFKGERPAELKGDYQVTATIQATDKDGKVTIWQREFPLAAKTSFTSKESTVAIDRELPIRINDYNAFVKKVTDEAKFTPDIVRLVVRWTVNVEAQTDAGIVKDQLTPTMIVPMGARYFEVTGELDKSKPGAIEKTIKATAPVNQKVATLFEVLFALAVALLLGLFYFTTEQRDVDPMQLKLKQILKTHADRLVAIDREIRANADQVMPVKSMDDLIRIADELGKPIIFEGKGLAAANFYVLDGGKVFVYEFGSTPTDSNSLIIDGPAPSRALRRRLNRGSKPSAGL